MKLNRSTLIFAAYSLHLFSIAVGQTPPDGFDLKFNGSVTALVVQEDGRIIVGGNFTAIGNILRTNLVRVRSDLYRIDPTFNSGLALSCGNCEPTIRTLALQTTGEVLVGGRFTGVGNNGRTNIVRLKTNGVVDSTFSPVVNGPIHKIASFSDGLILVAGGFSQINGQPRIGIAKIDSEGRLYGGFDADANGEVRTFAIQPSGRILIGGSFTSLRGEPRQGIGRVFPDGSLDVTFAPSSIASEITDIKVQSDGKVILSGNFDVSAGSTSWGVRRLNADGTLDTSFSHDTDGETRCLALGIDGRLLLGGSFNTQGGGMLSNIVRLQLDGSVDQQFTPGIRGPVNLIAIQSSSKIFVGGAFGGAGQQVRSNLALIYADGNLDSTLTSGISAGATVIIAQPIIAQPDGKVVIGGDFGLIGTLQRTNIARISVDGTPDPSFNVAVDIFPRCFAVQPDGKIIVAGTFTNLSGLPREKIGRLNPTGTPDASFTPPVIDGDIYALAVQPNGQILIGGTFTTVDGVPQQRMARLNPDGTPNLDFRPSINAEVLSIAVQSDMRVIVGGSFTNVNGQTRYRIARLDKNGSLDPDFSPVMGGNNPFVAPSVLCIALQADGKILVGGRFTFVDQQEYGHFVRLNVNGTLDTSFFPSIDSDVSSMALQVNGQIVIGGVFRDHAKRINSNGSTANILPTGSHVSGVALLPDGKAVIVGSTSYIGRSAPPVAPFESISVETSFGSDVIRWYRQGSAPECYHAAFQISVDGINFTRLGAASRFSQGWALENLSLPRNTQLVVRAFGQTVGGINNASASLVYYSSQVYIMAKPDLAAEIPNIDDGFIFGFSGVKGTEFVVLGTTNTSLPRQKWNVLGTPRAVAEGLYRFEDTNSYSHEHRYYQLVWP